MFKSVRRISYLQPSFPLAFTTKRYSSILRTIPGKFKGLTVAESSIPNTVNEFDEALASML